MKRTRLIVVAAHILLIASLLALFSTACTSNNNGGSNDGNTDKTTEAPKIPPQTTFVMDFSDFTGASSTGSQATASPLASYVGQGETGRVDVNALGDRTYFDFSAFNVGFWNLVGTFGLAIPVSCFTESLKQTPVKQPDGSWVWTYSVTVQFVTYTAELHGKYIDSGVRWDMYVTKQNEFTDYLWYYGESDLANTQGYWVLRAEPAKATDLLRIDWHRDPVKETGDIKYTNIVPNGPENGGYISFVVSDGQPYNRSYTIFNKGKNETTFIEWNETTRAGRVKDSVHFGDDSWHCWDSSLNNTVCS